VEKARTGGVAHMIRHLIRNYALGVVPTLFHGPEHRGELKHLKRDRSRKNRTEKKKETKGKGANDRKKMRH